VFSKHHDAPFISHNRKLPKDFRNIEEKIIKIYTNGSETQAGVTEAVKCKNNHQHMDV